MSTWIVRTPSEGECWKDTRSLVEINGDIRDTREKGPRAR